MGDELAESIREAEASFQLESSFCGEWSSAITEKNGRKLLKARLTVEGSPDNVSHFRNGVSGALMHGWPALQGILEQNLRNATGRVAVVPQKIWKVQGAIGCTWRILQLDVEATANKEVKDLFADAY